MATAAKAPQTKLQTKLFKPIDEGGRGAELVSVHSLRYKGSTEVEYANVTGTTCDKKAWLQAALFAHSARVVSKRTPRVTSDEARQAVAETWCSLWENVKCQHKDLDTGKVCTKTAEAGAHVYIEGESRSFNFSMPACKEHNGTKSVHLTATDSWRPAGRVKLNGLGYLLRMTQKQCVTDNQELAAAAGAGRDGVGGGAGGACKKDKPPKKARSTFNDVIRKYGWTVRSDTWYGKFSCKRVKLPK